MSAAISLAIDAAEAAPAVISGLTSIAKSVETDLAGHKAVLTTISDGMAAASASLQSAPVQAALGTQGEAVVEGVEGAASTGLTLWQKVEALAAEIKAEIAKL